MRRLFSEKCTCLEPWLFQFNYRFRNQRGGGINSILMGISRVNWKIKELIISNRVKISYSRCIDVHFVIVQHRSGLLLSSKYLFQLVLHKGVEAVDQAVHKARDRER